MEDQKKLPMLSLYEKIIGVASLKTEEEKIQSISEIFWYLLTHINDILYPIPRDSKSERINLIKIIYNKSKEFTTKTEKMKEICDQLISRITIYAKELPYDISL
jgi:signal recognition particle subunit SEC65